MPNNQQTTGKALPSSSYTSTNTLGKKLIQNEVKKQEVALKSVESATSAKVDTGGWIKFSSRGYQGL